MSEVMYLRMAVCTKTWGGVVVTCNLCVFSVSCIIIMNSNIFGILQAAIPLWSGMELITTYQFHDHTVLYCLLFMLSNCVSCRTSAYEATHAANWYFNTKYKMTLLRWPLCVTSLCNLNCMCSVLCVYMWQHTGCLVHQQRCQQIWLCTILFIILELLRCFSLNWEEYFVFSLCIIVH